MLIDTAIRFERRGNVGIQGANSQVFLAYDPQLDATLVVKEIPKASIDVARYFAEASKLYAVRHPNVAEVLYCSQTNDEIYLAMPEYDGSVEGVLRTRPLTVREIVRIGTDFLTGLHHVHTCNLLHFDIKPSNVLLDTSGKAVLTDFGLAELVNPSGLATPDKIYESHIAPEAMTMSPVLSAQADVYQAGLTLYRMCIGTALWNAQLRTITAPPNPPTARPAVARGAFPSRHGLPAHVPGNLRKLICKAIEVDPAARHPTILDLLNDLARVSENLDWQFTPAASEWTWEWSDASHLRRVILRPEASGTFSVAASRTSHVTGKVQNLSAVAASGLTAAKVGAQVEKAIDALTPSRRSP